MLKRRLALLVISILLGLFIAEAALRLLIQPSIFTKEPPVKIDFPSREILQFDLILEPDEIVLSRQKWYEGLIVDGKKITFGDLYGILKEDEVLGYAPKENAVSANGWWQSNNLGARSRLDTSPTKIPGKERILFFGESNTQGSRLPQDETFVFYLNESNPEIEALNFGVDGYSMSQSYLRFRTLKNKLEFDRVFLVWVPGADLKREINVSRFVGFGWNDNLAFIIQPRFIIENGELTHIPSPYKNLEDMVEDNRYSTSNRLKKHLREYDSYYAPYWYEPTPILDNLLINQLIKRELYLRDKKSIKKNLMNENSEAVQITKKIILNMAREVEAEGGKFTLIILPNIWENKLYSSKRKFRKKWNRMVSEVCSPDIICIDLMQDLEQVPEEKFDKAHDNLHYGPKSNRIIADIILKRAINHPQLSFD